MKLNSAKGDPIGNKILKGQKDKGTKGQGTRDKSVNWHFSIL